MGDKVMGGIVIGPFHRGKSAHLLHRRDGIYALLEKATVAKDGMLKIGGDIVTAEMLKAEMARYLIGSGLLAENTIVAPGTQGAQPHNEGSGPIRASFLSSTFFPSR